MSHTRWICSIFFSQAPENSPYSAENDATLPTAETESILKTSAEQTAVVKTSIFATPTWSATRPDTTRPISEALFKIESWMLHQRMNLYTTLNHFRGATTTYRIERKLGIYAVLNCIELNVKAREEEHHLK